MKATKYISIILLGLVTLMYACEPAYEEVSTIAEPSGTVDFTVTWNDDFNVTLTNTSSVDGIVQWDLGNKTKKAGDVVSTAYRMPDTYTVTLTIYAKGGVVSTSKDIVQEKTDYSIFSDPVYINLSGGVDAADGKTWVLDSLTKGHMGVGPPEGDWPEWWSADPLAKSNKGGYDDELTLKIADFEAIYVNHGHSYVKDFRKDDPAYSNQIQDDTDYRVAYPTPVNGTWSIVEDGDKQYLVLSASTPINPNFDTGAVDGQYEIQSLTENVMKLKCIGGDGNAWYYILIRKGYERPTISFDLEATPTGNPNEIELSLANVVIPDGESITSLAYAFGNGVMETTTTVEATVTNDDYMKKGTYTATVTAETSLGQITASVDVTWDNNHPDYVPPAEYVEEGMAMYANFDDTFSKIGLNGDNGSWKLIANPSTDGENTSDLCLEFNKYQSQWENMYIPLSEGFRFDFTVSPKFKLMVYGKAGTEVLLKVENMDLGGNAWQTGAEIIYTIQADDTWELAEYDFTGVGNNGAAAPVATDITSNPDTQSGYYNVVRVMVNPGNADADYQVLLDDWAGPLVEGWKKK